MSSDKQAPSLSSLSIEASITIGLETVARQIEDKCGEWLREPPKGIYTNTSVHPAMVDGGEYYYIEKGLTLNDPSVTRVPVFDVTKVPPGKSIYTIKNHKDVPVIFAEQIKHKDRCLSTAPILPYHGTLMAGALVGMTIDNRVRYNKYAKDIVSIIVKHLHDDFKTDEWVHDQCAFIIDEEYSDVRNTVMAFIGKYDWNIYFTRLKQTTVTVQRSIDWRVYDWMCRTHSGEWST